jgi:hypothetical protein
MDLQLTPLDIRFILHFSITLYDGICLKVRTTVRRLRTVIRKVRTVIRKNGTAQKPEEDL